MRAYRSIVVLVGFAAGCTPSERGASTGQDSGEPPSIFGDDAGEGAECTTDSSCPIGFTCALERAGEVRARRCVRASDGGYDGLEAGEGGNETSARVRTESKIDAVESTDARGQAAIIAPPSSGPTDVSLFENDLGDPDLDLCQGITAGTGPNALIVPSNAMFRFSEAPPGTATNFQDPSADIRAFALGRAGFFGPAAPTVPCGLSIGGVPACIDTTAIGGQGDLLLRRLVWLPATVHHLLICVYASNGNEATLFWNGARLVGPASGRFILAQDAPASVGGEPNVLAVRVSGSMTVARFDMTIKGGP